MGNESEHNGRIVTQLLGSGWAAVMLVDVHVDGAFAYVDVWDTGMGRYATQAEAQTEAQAWAADEGLPFVG